MTNVTDRHGDGTSLGQKFASNDGAPPLAEVSRANYRLRLATEEKDVRVRRSCYGLGGLTGVARGAGQRTRRAWMPMRLTRCVSSAGGGCEQRRSDRNLSFANGCRAVENHGYYSAQEFGLRHMNRYANRWWLGRAWGIAHRNLTVLSLLWKGIANYGLPRMPLQFGGLQFSADVAGRGGGRGGLRAIATLPGVAEEWRTNPLPKFICDAGGCGGAAENSEVADGVFDVGALKIL